MLIEPKIRGFICTTAHPQGCDFSVAEQIKYVKSKPSFTGPKNVLVIGASTGYGLASRIALSFGANAKTVGVFFEKAASKKRTATAGWYNTAAFEKYANEENLYATSINGDAFSNEIKEQTATIIKRDLGKIDCLVYSLASPRRTHPDTGETFSSTLKPIDATYTNKTVDPMKGTVSEVSLEPATSDDVDNTVTVMGGDDWQRWIDYLRENDLLADNFTTVAYSYIGPELTFPIYTNGTIGQAKKHLQQTADELNDQLKSNQGRALISVNKALVTQSSSAIPVVPLYMSILFKIMKENGTHEGCIEQMHRLFSNQLYSDQNLTLDDQGRIRLDDLEMQPAVQEQVDQLWQQVNSDNIDDLTDLASYQRDFYRLFGFNWDGVDYTLEADPNVDIPSLVEVHESVE